MHTKGGAQHRERLMRIFSLVVLARHGRSWVARAVHEDGRSDGGAALASEDG